MLHGLAAYGDEPLSDHEDVHDTVQDPRATTPSVGHSRMRLPQNTDDTLSKSGADTFSGITSSSKAQIVIKKPHHMTIHPRAPLPETERSSIAAAVEPLPRTTDDDTEDELTRIRILLRPSPISGIDDWGIPPLPTGTCDPGIDAKLAQFHALKRDPNNPKHFNDSLMANRSFRNPHLYTKLVEFVDVNEKATNFPKSIWNPEDVKEEWFADQIAEFQKKRSEEQSAAQSSGKRSHLEFTSSKNQTSTSSSKQRTREYRERTTGDHRGRYQPYGLGGGREKGFR